MGENYVKCSDYKNLNLAFNGYNIINGNRMADGADPGFGLQIFKAQDKSCNNNFIQVDQNTYCNKLSFTLVPSSSSFFVHANPS